MTIHFVDADPITGNMRAREHSRRGGRFAWSALVVTTLVAWTSVSLAQSVVSASPDVTIAVGPGNVVAADEAIVVDNRLGVVGLQSIGAIPESADVKGYADAGAGTFLFSVDTTVSLPGGLVASPNDVVAWNGAAHSIRFDGSVQGVPSNVQIDAIGTAANNGLVLSFDTDVTLPGGITVADEDLVKASSGAFTVVLDGSTVGMDRALDVDGAQDIGGGYLLSFDTAGTVGSVTFQDEDILRYVAGSWSLEFDGSSGDSDWESADLDALQVPEPNAVAMLVGGIFGVAGLRRLRGRASLRAR